MAKFRYKRGDRPLDGYTIEHGLGVGGFGEVYFAISDAGREVALKSLQNYQEIELRGIRHCMNLKSPHLVSVFDVRYNDDEEPFVIMEYVQGPCLRQLLDASPEGLGPAKSAFFLREMAKGMTYLHEAGVVHRDLKPHNVFYEDGFVKIGDYSLCKLISTSHRTGHTMTVGTVHYMAPEISQGRYDASVDIYALGIMLHEMLTGLPPFQGDSMGEVLMKHMTAEPDLSAVEEPYRSVIAKALSKNPDDRYETAADMVEAVFGTEHVQNSVVEFNPQELTMVANMATKRAFATPSGRQAPGGSDGTGSEGDGARGGWSPGDGPRPKTTAAQKDTDIPIPPETVLFEKKPRNFVSEEPTPKHRVDKDNISLLARAGMAGIAVMALGYIVNLTAGSWLEGDLEMLTILTIVAGFFAAMLARLFVSRLPIKNALLRRLAIGGGVALSVVASGSVIGLWSGFGFGTVSNIMQPTVIALPFFIFDWFGRTSRNRSQRIDGWLLLFTVLFAFAGAMHFYDRMWFPALPALAPIVAFGIGICLQLVAPFNAFRTGAVSKAGLSPQPSVLVASLATANVIQAEPIAQTSPPVPPQPASPTGRLATDKSYNGQLAVRIMCRIFGLIFFTASCVMAILAIQPMLLSHNSHRGDPEFSVIGFGLLVPAFGLLIGSNGWTGGAFGRLVAACMMLAWLHIACLNGDFDAPLAMMLPTAAMLLAWPNKTSKKTKG